MYALSHLLAVDHLAISSKATLTSANQSEVYVAIVRSNSSNKVVKLSASGINNLAERMNCALELTEQSPLPSAEASGRWYFESLIGRHIQSSALTQQGRRQYELLYSIRGKKISTEVFMNPAFTFREWEYFWFTAQAIKDGYRFEEMIGLDITVVTPNCIRRSVSSLQCDCKEYREILKEQKPCLHLKMLDVFRRKRSVLNRYGLIKTISSS